MFSTEKEPLEYSSNAFWDSVTISFSKCAFDMRRDFYTFSFESVIL